MPKIELDAMQSGFLSVALFNENFDKIEAALDNTLSRDGSTPNQMEATLDMNSNRIINLAAPVNPTDAARLMDVDGSGGVEPDTPAELLTKIKTVDGTGSGLDADLIDGFHASAFVRSINGTTPDGSGDIEITVEGETAASLLTKIKTVDGTGSGLDADLLGGLNSAAFVRTINGTAPDGSGNVSVVAGGDAETPSTILTKIKTVDGTGSGLDADLLDGLHSTSFVRSINGTTPDSGGNVTVTESAPDLLTKIKTVDGAASGLDADLIDGYHAASFVRSINGTVPDASGNVTVTTSGGGTILPSITGQSGKFLTNNGTSLSWAAIEARQTANVNDYLLAGDTNYNGAFSRCLAANNVAYVPPIPSLVISGSAHVVTQPIILSDGQTIFGDGAGVSRIASSSANTAVIRFAPQIYNFVLRDFTVYHTVPTTAGGDGIQQGQGATDWINSGYISNVLSILNYNGFNLGKCYRATVLSCDATSNVNHGFSFVTDGLATVPSGSANGPLQWVLNSCATGSNGTDGYYYSTTGTPYGGTGGSPMGTMTSCVSYDNGRHGIAILASPTHAIHGFRVKGGFFGEDNGCGIYVDTYSRDHLICPDFVELSGQHNIFITANNENCTVQVQNVGGANWDGLYTAGIDTTITGGVFVNNGRRGADGAGLKWSGIRVGGGSATIAGVTSKNSSSSIQSYGISVSGDDVVISGCRFRNNADAPIYWQTGPTNSIVTGCLPASANGGSNTVTGNLVVTGSITAGTDLITPMLHVNGASAFTGDLNVTGTGTTLYINNGGVVARDVTALRSGSVGTSADGVAGKFKVGDIAMTGTLTGATSIATSGNVSSGATVSGANVTATSAISAGTTVTAGTDLITPMLHVNGPSAFTGDLNVTGTGTTIYNNNGGIVGQDVTALRSGSVGTSADGVAGKFKVGSIVMTGALSGATSITTPGDVTAQDVTALRSIGVGTYADGVSGKVRAGDIAMTGTLTGATSIATSGNVSSGATVSGYNLTTTNSIYAGTTITAGTDLITPTLHVNGPSAFTGDINVTGTGTTIYNNNGGIVGQDVTALRSGSVGTAADGVAGKFKVGEIAMTGTLTGATSIATSGNVSSGATVSGATLSGSNCTVSGAISAGTTVTAGTELITPILRVNGPSVFNSHLYVEGTGTTMYINNGGAVIKNLNATSMSLGPLGVPSTPGVLNVSNGIYLNGVGYTNP